MRESIRGSANGWQWLIVTCLRCTSEQGQALGLKEATGLLSGACLAVNRRCWGSLGGALVQLTVWWALIMEASWIWQERPGPPGKPTPRSSFFPTTLNSPGFPLVSVPRLGLISVLRPHTASELTYPQGCVCVQACGVYMDLRLFASSPHHHPCLLKERESELEWEREKDFQKREKLR